MWQALLGVPLIALVAITLPPVALFYGVASFIWGKWLQLRVKNEWPSRVAMLVYSNNPKWAPYLESNLLKDYASVCIVVDRSKAQWKTQNPLAKHVVAHWGGWRNHNPLAVVFPRSGKPRVFRLYEPFQRAKRGRTEALEDMMLALREAISSQIAQSANKSLGPSGDR